ncbi:MAG: metallophosphoesterase [Lachnospiraceae bacterium]|nr:metallophosphoesterase [Lachnospiraceae bacterium]
MKILHLSDLHFHFEDPISDLLIRFEKMLLFLKDNTTIDHVVITGDHILFSDPEKNFEIFNDFIFILKNKLSIDSSRIHMCSGNHEWIPMSGDPFKNCSDDYMQEKCSGLSYISSYEKICERKWEDHGMVEVVEDENTVLVIADAFFGKDNNNKGYFLRNCKKLNKIISEYFVNDNRIHVIAQHAREEYYCHSCDNTVCIPSDTIILCGHKLFLHSNITLKRGVGECIYSGISDGFVGEHPVYGIIETGGNGTNVKFFEYSDNEWKWMRSGNDKRCS